MLSSGGGGSRDGLRLEPIRAITYADPSVLPRVTCPPYDVVGADGIAAFEAADPHNVVRLILPRAGDSDDRYHHAARDLNAWLSAGVLVSDERPALWVYRQSTSAGVTIGLVGAVGLDGPVLPHESTFEGPVADRVALMAVTGAQLEPILLTYHGDGIASDVVDAALETPPTISTAVGDGSRHDLWRIADPGTHAAVAADLAPRRALIADGHHRFAAYQRLHTAGPTRATAAGLAVLVDATRHPLDLRGVHRVVGGLDLDTALAAALARGFETVGDAEPADWLDDAARREDPTHGDVDRAPRPAEYVITDGVRGTRIRATPSIDETMPPDRSARWTGLDAAVLKHGLIAAAWGLDDAEARVVYVHDRAEATRLAGRHGGVAALVSPPALDDVMALAQAGETMPQKSTSFGPKPRTGLIMRSTH